MAIRSAATLLAGGQARRMGGGDKNLMMLAGKPVLRHVLDRVDFADRPLMINANGDPARYAAFCLPVCADVIDGYAGPLAGILTGLEWVAANHSDCSHMVSLATDAPFLPVNLIAVLESAIGDGAEIAQAMSLHRRHPVFAIWPVAIAGALRDAVIDEGVRKIDDFTARYHCVTVEFAGTPDPFMNLNRPDDFDLATQILGQ
ncbi:MAG: molybdenum cofactor guanylyltransferase MobA [Alphaproteobacteria bacterium]|jgi:molybdopterin-guanine dinucleotide biosynthesis protein A|nr:molybdenum cofactor guanylyltransferase MobA [Alphaproteobacteria bacterium]NDA17954.1 molybdenum cofactor guanylyltransferase MobA [Alphaproteobacteria bacterium]